LGVALKETIAVLLGDGIGPEVIVEAVKVLDALDLGFEFIQCEVGSKAYNDVGTPRARVSWRILLYQSGRRCSG
jgi:isocitrate/isopropylmalate dehydrogenase